jgi:hypothetical protein
MDFDTYLSRVGEVLDASPILSEEDSELDEEEPFI